MHGAPQLDPAEVLDRRAMRFMAAAPPGTTSPWTRRSRTPGLEPDEVSNERTGIIMGSGGPSTRAIVEAADMTRDEGRRSASDRSPCRRRCRSTARRRSPRWFKIKGVNYSISSACATSNHCIGNAYEMIQLGKQDVIFAGGCEELDWTLSVLFDGMGAMSTGFNDTPEKASRAYDAKRDGFVIAGGAGVVVVEELEHAKARGAKIYGEITGYGATSDGFDMVQPSGEGAVRCMRMALSTVKEPIDYINPHATSTPIGDEREIEAIREVFGAGDKCPPISATKSLTGHSLGATGVQETIYCLLMMQNGFICESANIDELDPKFADMPIVRERRDDVRARTPCSPTPSASAAPTPRWCSSATPAEDSDMSSLMAGKRGLIMGVANDHSIAWGIAKQLAARGRRARLHLSGRAFRPAREAARRLARLDHALSLRRRGRRLDAGGVRRARARPGAASTSSSTPSPSPTRRS